MMIRLLLLFCFLLRVYCDDDTCNQYNTCTVCVRSPDCHWCSTEDDTITKRCMSNTKPSRCKQNEIENPQGKVTTKEERDFNSDVSRATQIKPQSFKINLRPGQEQTFNFSFRAAEDYPADLYFLFDASSTMTLVLQTAADASEKIYKEILSKTKNVQLGMGTFIDKNAAPFVREKVANINSFYHRLDMTTNFTHFKEHVNLVQKHFTAANHDEPEGGFDALAQVLACKDKFGWRDVSRKIIFFFTDNLSHSAGDGKSAGIVYPYDGKCYTKDRTYTEELKLDYPSIGMINELAAREEITIVFIVDKKVQTTYEYLTKHHIRGARNIFYERPRGEILEFSDSANSEKPLDNILTETYESITRKIKLYMDMEPEDQHNLVINFDPDCSGRSKQDKQCEIHENEKRFQGRIKMRRFYGKPRTEVKVSIEGIKETLTLDIEVVDCNCKPEKNSEYCNKRGTKKCGVCECDDDSTGKKCECDKNYKSTDETEEKCKQKGENQICSGYGHCECGVCQCVPDRGGEFCQCANENYHLNGHGDCFCGVCKCHPGWTGNNCECHNSTCTLVNEKECNGPDRGDCVCGSCQCKHPALWDARHSQTETCEIQPCTDCHHEQCNLIKECAICRQKNDEEYCKEYCEGIVVVVNETLGEKHSENAKTCENVSAGMGCITRFRYEYDEVNYKIHVLIQSHTENDCTPSYYMWGGIGLLLLVLIAVVTLVAWKLLTDLQDRREYNRFVKSQDGAAAICMNDIYQPPTTTFSNPAFRKRSVDHVLR